MTVELDVVAAASANSQVNGVLFVKGPEALASDGGIDLTWLATRGFEGNAGQIQVANVGGKTVVALGLGDRSDVELDTVRRTAAAFTKTAWKATSAALDVANLTTLLALDAPTVSQAVAEGLLLGAYRFNDYKSKPDEPALERITLVNGDQGGVDRGVVVSAAVALTRDLINHPAGTMTPRRLAEEATKVAAAADLDIEVWDEAKIASEKLGGLLGVAAGSNEPPRFVKLTYNPAGGSESTVALVGKGITFDSGGLSLKPPEGMMTMKTDMSGAASVIAVMSTLPKLKPKTKVIGICCITENLPGPSATKPGDVLRARNGKTMEVLNTDAEGRLVLADGLSLAVEAEVDAIVDIATLTGACIVALGTEVAGLMTNNDDLRQQVQTAAAATGENMWHLPLPKKYRKHIDSEIADIKNIGAPKGSAGALSAGLFLQEFVGDTPWVHLDIAGPARSDSDDGYNVKGATGFSVRTLIELVGSYQKP